VLRARRAVSRAHEARERGVVEREQAREIRAHAHLAVVVPCAGRESLHPRGGPGPRRAAPARGQRAGRAEQRWERREQIGRREDAQAGERAVHQLARRRV
jgi:hypothetical protein